MATTIEYALMAGASYYDTRAEVNRFPVPDSWLEKAHVPNNPDYPMFIGAAGFEAVSFQNIVNPNEIVISYAGTYDKDITGDIAADVRLVLGTGSAQLLQAVEYYLQIKVVNPGATITLTGHSLGGGLAALVGVFFGVQATTFDQAPFAQTALFGAPSLLADLTGKLDGNGNRVYSDAALAPLSGYIAQKQVFGVPITFIPNTGLVSNVVVQGEMLSVPPGNIPGRIGTTIESISNSATGASAGDLHAQALLAAFLQSRQTAAIGKALNDVTVKLPDLLKMIFDSKLFAYRTDDADNRNLIDHLDRHEAGVRDSATGATTLAADAMLTRFTADLWKLAQDDGLTLHDGNPTNADLHELSKALTAFAMQFYYENTANATDATKHLFTDLSTTGTGSNGIRFDMHDVSTTAATAIDANQKIDLTAKVNGNDVIKGYQYFKNYLAQQSNPLTGTDKQLIQSLLPYMRDWYIQAGASGMNAADTLNRGAFMLGGTEGDYLTGGSGADLLVGNAGNDELKGGLGNNFLLGGKGNDTYRYNTGDGFDTIFISDDNGSIAYDGSILAGGAQYGDVHVSIRSFEFGDGTTRWRTRAATINSKAANDEIVNAWIVAA